MARELSNAAKGAKNLKRELAKAFPGVKFSVRSDYFSMGCSIDVGWTLGPTTKEVEAVAKKFEYGTFDPMIDLSGTDPDAYARSEIHGGAKFVQCHRRTTDALFEQVCIDLCSLQHIEYKGMNTRYLCGEGDPRSLREHANMLIAITSFGPDEQYQGVAYYKGDNPTQWAEIVKTV